MKEGLYEGLDAEFYDELLDGEINDLPFWQALLKQFSGSFLEVACGTGRIMIPLLQAGLDIEGVDKSARMIDLLSEKGRKLGLEINAMNQAMETLGLGKTFSLIFIPGFSLQMIDSRDALIQALHGFHKHLEPGGRLAVSLFFPWEELEDDGPGGWRLRKKIKRADGSRLECRQSTRINTEEQSLTVKNRYTLLNPDREIVEEEHRDVKLLWFYPHEFHLLLDQSGFVLEETYSDYEFEPMDELTPHAVFLARKPEA